MNKLFLKLNSNEGFTLVEMMVAISIFTIVIVFGISALLNVNKIHKANQKMRQLVDTLDFAMEDMSRNIRLGYDYYCVTDDNVDAGIITYNNLLSPIQIGVGPYNNKKDCIDKFLGNYNANKKAIIFEGMNGIFPHYGNSTAAEDEKQDQIIYKMVQENGSDYLTLKKSSDGSSSFADMITKEIHLNNKSGFYVFNSSPSGLQFEDTDYGQPRVLIRLSGEIVYKDVTLPFDIQTTVAERYLDN